MQVSDNNSMILTGLKKAFCMLRGPRFSTVLFHGIAAFFPKRFLYLVVSDNRICKELFRAIPAKRYRKKPVAKMPFGLPGSLAKTFSFFKQQVI
jgi:hypothetical protein